jgi:SAM-dependent methyltransferase
MVRVSQTRREGGPAQWADPAPTYNRVASAYAERFRHELNDKPFDRELLSRFAASAAASASPASPVCDLGCGPGHVGAFMAALGLDVIGIDLSAGMVAQARHDHPTLTFVQGDMTALALPDQAFAAIVCFYALIHIPRAYVLRALREMRRVLVAGGALLLAVHGGNGTLHADEMVGQPADLDATLFQLSELSELLDQAGFAMVEAHRRAPYEEEHPTMRLYLWAIRPT